MGEIRAIDDAVEIQTGKNIARDCLTEQNIGQPVCEATIIGALCHSSDFTMYTEVIKRITMRISLWEGTMIRTELFKNSWGGPYTP